MSSKRPRPPRSQGRLGGLFALALLALACRDPVSIPAYLVGPASFAVVVDSAALQTGFYRVGDSVSVAFPGDSVCVYFDADGNWQTLLLWNAVWPRLELQWVPHDVVRNVTLRFLGTSWRETTTSPTLC